MYLPISFCLPKSCGDKEVFRRLTSNMDASLAKIYKFGKRLGWISGPGGERVVDIDSAVYK
jgi:hypothetical protein